MFRRNAAWACAACMLALIFIRPQQAVDGAQRAMRLWYTGVAPAMLPFLALMPALTSPEACAAYRRLFSGVMEALFRLPGSAAPAVVAAMIGGSPGGAVAVRNCCASGGITASEARRIALALAGVSPAWLVMGVGCGMLGSKAAGVKLALIQAAVQLILLKTLEKVKIGGAAQRAVPQAEGRNFIWPAVETALSVCGYMVVFSACGSVIASFAGKKAGAALLAVLDLPSGVAEIAEMSMAAVGCALGFGGICIGAQNIDALREIGVDWKEYFAVRGVAASLTALFCALCFRNPPLQADAAPPDTGIYAFSLLIASLCAVPGMIFISKNIFLNNRKMRAKELES